MASISVKVNMGKSLTQKLQGIINPTTMLAVHNALAKRCDPYVPFLEGPLSQTVQVSEKGVRYTQPYARRQYFGDDFNFTKDHHPLASARWDEAMLRDHGDEFKQEVTEIIQERLREVQNGR